MAEKTPKHPDTAADSRDTPKKQPHRSTTPSENGPGRGHLPSDRLTLHEGNSLHASATSGVRSRLPQEGSSYGLTTHWSVPWSDIMMVMFVMFAVMFAVQLSEQDVQVLFQSEQAQDTGVGLKANGESERDKTDKMAPPGVSGLPLPVEEILRLSEQLVADANLENIDVVLTDKQAIKVSVRGPLLFDLGKADLKPDAVEFLKQLALIIAKNNYEIQVIGHTDNFPISTPEYPTNWELSAARAARVARFLIRAGHLDPGRFTVIGHAFYRPSLPNTSLANKARNRRVEIIITRNEYQP